MFCYNIVVKGTQPGYEQHLKEASAVHHESAIQCPLRKQEHAECMHSLLSMNGYRHEVGIPLGFQGFKYFECISNLAETCYHLLIVQSTANKNNFGPSKTGQLITETTS